MLKNIFTLCMIAVITVSAIVFGSCSDDPVMPQKKAANSDLLLSRSGDAFSSNWENYQTWNFRNGSVIGLPWNSNHVQTSVRKDFLDDIKKEDGWTLLHHSLAGGDVESDDAADYIILYNQLSSQMKVFLYVNNIGTASSGYWIITLENGTYPGLLNDLSDINLPASLDDNKQAIVSNISNNNGLFTSGWEMILFNVSYNPDYNGVCTLNITSKASLGFNVNLDCEMNSTAHGTLTSYVQNSAMTKQTNKMFSAYGESAESILNERYGLNDSRGGISPILEKILKKGLNKIFKSFVSRRDNSTQQNVQDLQFTTHTTGTISGTMEGEVTSIPSIGTVTLPIDRAKLLGNWNLKENPTIYIHPVGIMIGAATGSPDQLTYGFTASGNYKYNLSINPELKQYIKNQKVELTPVSYIGSTLDLIPGHHTDDITDRGSLTSNGVNGITQHLMTNRNKLIETTDKAGGKLIICEDMMRASLTYYGIENNDPTTKAEWPYSKYVFAPEHKIYQRGELKYYKNHYRLKVTVTITANFGGEDVTCVSTRTYIPKIELDPTLVKYYTGYDLSGLYQAAECDTRLDKLRGFTYPSQGGILSVNETKKIDSDSDKEISNESKKDTK